jgi:hypothetical protein
MYCGELARIQKLQNLGIMQSCPSLGNVLVKHTSEAMHTCLAFEELLEAVLPGWSTTV